jgi:hypothetical protein
MISKLVLIVGILGILLGGAVLLICVILVATQGGRVSFDEALPGMIGGCACSFVSLILAVVGLVLVLKNRKKSASGS